MNLKSIEEQDLIRHVERICESPEFRTKQVLCRFLSYIVSETLAGRGEDLKAFNIGVDVFNRDDDFDPAQDTLVRINAVRLRRMLELYYSNTGREDALRIEIPKGGYVPKIVNQPDAVTKSEEKAAYPGKKEEPEVTKELEQRDVPYEPFLAVLCLKDLKEDPENTFFVRGFSYELLVELSKFEDLQVFNYLSVSDPPEPGTQLHGSLRDKGIRFTIGGAVHGDRERINILVELKDLYEGTIVWCERYSRKLAAQSLIEIQESIAREISGKLGSEYGIILRRLAREAHRVKPQKLGTYSAVLKYYNYLSDTSPETAKDAFDALNRAVQNDPHSGIAHACLSALHGTHYAMDSPGAAQSYAAAGELAEKGYLLDSNSIFVQLALVYKCFLYDEKARFFHLVERLLERNPASTLRLGALGFHLALYGDWERGKQILDTVMYGHLEFANYFYGVTTLYYYRTGAYEEAYKEARRYHVPGFFWGPMLRVACLGQLKRNEEAMEDLKQLKQMKPGFQEKAHYLISRFVKEKSLVFHVLEGLQKAGLTIHSKSQG